MPSVFPFRAAPANDKGPAHVQFCKHGDILRPGFQIIKDDFSWLDAGPTRCPHPAAQDHLSAEVQGTSSALAHRTLPFLTLPNIDINNNHIDQPPHTLQHSFKSWRCIRMGLI
jgi:hypothetical protein